jgi:glycosyltransferase involved in cell wall biosynthesis
MRIIIDTDSLHVAKTGVKTYIKETVKALREQGVDVVEMKREPDSFFIRNQMKNKFFLHGGRILWTQIILPLKILKDRKPGDVLLSPEYFTPYFSPIPNMVTVHDAVFETQKENYSNLFRKTLKYIVWPAVRKASRVLTVSKDAKMQISEKIKIEKEKIEVTYLGVKSNFEIDKTFDDTNEPFFLYVGVLEKRKNLPRAIEAFNIVHQQYKNLKFYIVGQPAQFHHLNDSERIESLISDLKLRESVKLLGYVDDERLNELYNGALGLVFVSTYEGFGLPIVEGYNAGIPVLTSKGGATEEIAGNAALLCDPYDVTDISSCLLQLYEKNELREKLISLGNIRKHDFTWSRMAKQLLEISNLMLNRNK